MTFRPYAAIIAEAQSSNSKVTAEIKNESGSSIAALLPVVIDANGTLNVVDVSTEASALKTSGILESTVADNALGTVVLAGKIENVSTSFNFGDYLYVSKTGGLTNIQPSLGVASFVSGDFVIRIGLVSRNRTTPANKDYLIRVEIVGQL